MSSPMANLEKFLIPLKEIMLATENFKNKNWIANGQYGSIYRGQLSESWENRTAVFKLFDIHQDLKKEFLNELKVISILNHENIIPFLGYCDEHGGLIIVYDYYPAVSLSLADHLKYPDKRSCLTWQHRLEICLDAVRVLGYLHSGLGQHGTVIHGYFMDINILLDDNLKAKIWCFENSELIPGNQPCKQVYKPYTDDMPVKPFTDPIYLETGFLKAESDIYSVGVLLFRILTGPEVFLMRNDPEDYMLDSLTLKVQHHYHNRLDSIIDPAIRDQLGGPSFRMIEEIACKCLSFNIKDRPTVDTLVKTIKDALDIHNQEAISVKGSHREYQNPREFHIPLEEIELAKEISESSSLPPCSIAWLYLKELSERWPNRTVVLKKYFTSSSSLYLSECHRNRQMFYNELNIVSRFHHQNIIPYLGYCDEGEYQIIIYEHSINGSLRDHLQDQDKLRCLPWEQRLKICLGAARGLRRLHSGLWDDNRLVVHRHVRSEYILLDENMEAKISEFGLSIFVPKNKQVFDKNWEPADSAIIKRFKKSMDPIYKQSYIVNPEVDVYSFGCVMFEILCGLITMSQRADVASTKPDLIREVHHHYGDNQMDKLIDPNLRDQTDGRSLQTFVETAYRCLSYDIKERPSMNRIVKKIEEALYFQKHGATDSTTTIRRLQFRKLEDLRIPFKEIKLDSKIGKGAFGVVYKGRLSESRTKHEVAFKCLIKTTDKEKTGFLEELKLISKFHHQNIIRLIGYCDDGDKMILVCEYAINGSLDDHLEDPKKRCLLTWNKRLKICLGAAKGLDYLHSGMGEDSKVIHRDVKCANILLDDNFEAKICDFGLSKSGSTYDYRQSKHYTGIAGTDYYLDPVYHESGILRTESDVYSFGVVMFEMLSGMPAYSKRQIGDNEPRPLLNLVRRYYDYGKELLIDPQIKKEIDSSSFHTFIDIAYQCISFNSKERPSMETITDKIEEALEFQAKMEISS